LEIPAFAGMTLMKAGMTLMKAGMTVVVWNDGGHDTFIFG
jgi:hypothetical protein